METIAEVNRALRSNPEIAIAFASVCAQRAEKYANKLSRAALKYAQRAKDCAASDLLKAAEHAVFSSQCASHAPISGNENLKDSGSSEKRKKILEIIAEETAWQIKTLSAMLNK